MKIITLSGGEMSANLYWVFKIKEKLSKNVDEKNIEILDYSRMNTSFKYSYDRGIDYIIVPDVRTGIELRYIKNKQDASKSIYVINLILDSENMKLNEWDSIEFDYIINDTHSLKANIHNNISEESVHYFEKVSKLEKKILDEILKLLNNSSSNIDAIPSLETFKRECKFILSLYKRIDERSDKFEEIFGEDSSIIDNNLYELIEKYINSMRVEYNDNEQDELGYYILDWMFESLQNDEYYTYNIKDETKEATIENVYNDFLRK